MSAIVKAAHGLVAGQRVVFSSLVGGVGIDPDTIYWVVPVVNADDFQIAETQDGTPITFTTVTSANMQVVPETTDTDPDNPSYTAITDPADAMAPPLPVPTPSAPTVGSALVSGIVRIQIALNDTAEAKVRAWEVQFTHNYSGATPDFTTPQKLTMPEGSTTASLPALGSTLYAVRVSATDVYGNVSDWSSVVEHTTVAGSDSLQTSVAAVANDISRLITETDIQPGSISTPLLQTGAVTADILAATIILSSLIKTANSGRRIEIDVDGIRLYDTDESLLVRIPTNGDPVYIKGQVTADTLISQVAASFRGTVDLAGNSATTLQNGISDPVNVPTLAASVDSLALTGTALPSSAIGIAYDSAAGTFWVAVDPASGYVAYEYNATTGAFVRRIPATGSTTTTTTTAGATSHISDTAQGIDGSTNSHITTPIVMPNPSGASNMKITKVSAYFAGHNGSCSARVGVWSTSNIALRESATFTASSGGATTLGASDQYNKSLSSPLAVTPGGTYRVGFRHTSTSEGFQFDRDDGSGKTTYSGDGTTDDGTGWGTLNSASKPNVYVTLTYDVDTRLETAPMIGVATDGTYVYTLDTNGVIWKYDRTTMAHVAHSSVQTAITGTKSKAGLFYDATATELIITTTTGTGTGVFPKFVRVTPSTLAVSSSVYSASAGTTFNGATDTFRGGVLLADPLNASAATYWVATSNAVYAYTFSGTAATQTANRDFGQNTTVSDGLLHDGTQFMGFDAATPTKLWKFSNWDWTTASAIYWFAYAWYDSNATGGTHETGVSPRASLTLRRRERVQVTTPAIPTGGTDDPNNVRIYILPNASDPGSGASYHLQATDALTARYLTDYNSGGAANQAANTFPAGTPASIGDTGGHWFGKGDGSFQLPAGVTGEDQTLNGSTTDITVGGGGTATFSSRTLEWFRIGRMVFVRISVTVSGNGSGASAVTFTSATCPPPRATGRVWIDRGGTGVQPIVCRITNSGGFLQIASMNRLSVGAAYTDQSNIVGADLLNGAAYSGTFAYMA